MIKFHELKDKLIDELHNRPFPQIKFPRKYQILWCSIQEIAKMSLSILPG